MKDDSNNSKIQVHICGVIISLLGNSKKTSEVRQVEENINRRFQDFKYKYPNLTEAQLMALSLYKLEYLHLKLTQIMNYYHDDHHILECKSTNNKTVIIGLDPLFEEVARLVVNSNNASTSSFQRRFAIGYNRAGKIMDQLEKVGVVGPARGVKPREILIDQEGLENLIKKYSSKG